MWPYDDHSEEKYREYLDDVKIAVSELTNMKLYPVEGNIVCDLYAIPSHIFQSYYAIVYEKGNTAINCCLLDNI